MSRIRRALRVTRRFVVSMFDVILLSPEADRGDLFHQPPDPQHPSQLCRCDDGRPYPQSVTQHVDHRIDCEWRALWCQECDSHGTCSRCSGDGIEPEIGTTTAAEDWRTACELAQADGERAHAENARLRAQIQTIIAAAGPDVFMDGDVITVDDLLEYVGDAGSEAPGTWTAHVNPYGHQEVHAGGRSILTGPLREVTTFVAAFDPPRVAKMLLEIKRLRLRNKRFDAADRRALDVALGAVTDIRDQVLVDGYDRPLACRAVEIISNLLDKQPQPKIAQLAETTAKHDRLRALLQRARPCLDIVAIVADDDYGSVCGDVVADIDAALADDGSSSGGKDGG